MPTLRPDKGNRWLARVVINGKQITCKMFPPGKKFGPQWRAAKNWEEEELAKALQARETRTDLDRLMAWGNEYLSHAKRTMSHKTYVEKQLVMREFFNFCGKEGVTSLEDISSSVAHRFLVQRYEEGGANVANKYRKNLLAAWTWGLDFVEDFPQVAAPFRKIPPFSVTHGERYVPPEEDVIKVLHQARGQDLVMLLTLFYTGARRGEVFRLTWQDVNLPEGKLRLRAHKTGNGRERVRWLRLHPELVKALSWWSEARPLRLIYGTGPECGPDTDGHYRATTTDRYIKSAGLYTDQERIVTALGGSGIGQVVGDLLEKEIPQERNS